MKKILLIAGHGDGDPGASGNGFWEADLTREVVKLLKPKLAEMCSVDVADTSKNWYTYLKKHSYDFTKYDYVLEIHFNSGGGTGTEIFVRTDEKGTAVEAAIVKQICAATGYRNRGVKRRDNLLVMNTVKRQGVSHALLEVCFIDSAADMHTYTHDKNKVIDAIVNGIAEGFGLTRGGSESHWAAVYRDKLKAQGFVNDDVWANYDADIPVSHALALLDNISGKTWASDEADASVHWCQPIIISLCGKGYITDKNQFIELVKRDAKLPNSLCLALMDKISGGMVDKYVDRNTDHWARNCLDSLCDKKIIATPTAWTDFNGATTYGRFMAVTCNVIGV